MNVEQKILNIYIQYIFKFLAPYFEGKNNPR